MVMRCLTPSEAEAILGASGFSVSVKHAWYRVALVLERNLAAGQARIGGRPTPDVARLARFAEAVNRWLPTNRGRLLWVDHTSVAYPSPHALFMAARAGLGETRPLSAAPGHYFDPHPYDQEDQTEISEEHAKQVGIMLGLMSLIMIGAWDAWLIADNSVNRVEFWEGNIFFHSSETPQIARAKSLMREFNCPEDLR
jgi:hypothetical protein